MAPARDNEQSIDSNHFAWHTQTAAQSIKHFATHKKNGLTTQQVTQLQKQGRNQLPQQKKFSKLRLFFEQFNNILIYILIIAAGISGVLGEMVDAYIIAAAIFANILVGYVQEYKAQNALEKLAQVIENFALVIRDGREQRIHAEDLVPGDLIILTAGNNIPADCRLIQAQDFEVNEASLTGESIPVIKTTRTLRKKDVVISQQSNMAFMGTLATRGTAIGVVVAIGAQTEIGNIAQLIKDTKIIKTPLQRNLEIFSKNLGGIILFICAGILVIGLLKDKPFVEVFIVAIAAAVSAIPEGLVIAVTVILAIGMQRILQQQALVRKLVAAETLGSTDVVCSDKTGTLTQGDMIVERIITADGEFESSHCFGQDCRLPEDVQHMITIGGLLNHAIVANPQENVSLYQYTGAPTEIALLRLFYQAGQKQSQAQKKYPIIDEELFSSANKYARTLNKSGNERLSFLTGAPEKLINFSTHYMSHGRRRKMTPGMAEFFNAEHDRLGQQGLRIIAAAQKIVASKTKKLDAVSLQEYTLLGFFVIKDPVRISAQETISLAQTAGIRTIMITGDHRNTAHAIAQELGIQHSSKVLSGEDLAVMSDQELLRSIDTVGVYARVSPADKLRIVQALQSRQHIVAMTGDGINDAPALKAADIGIAVGSGTDVTKGVADMVLLDNNFKTIIAAIREGRVIVDNIKKVIVYLLADAFSSIVLVLGSLILGLPLPISASQILWINLITDGFPYMALTAEPGEKDVMKFPPRKRNSGILDSEMKAVIFIIGLATDLILFGLFYHFYSQTGDIQQARTIIFAALGLYTLLYSFSCKSLRKPLWRIKIWDNKYLIWAVLAGLAIHFFTLYTPFMKSLFKLGEITASQWGIILVLGIVKIIGIEFVKGFFAFKRR